VVACRARERVYRMTLWQHTPSDEQHMCLRQAAADGQVPVHDALVRMIWRWERLGLKTERYELLYRALGFDDEPRASAPGAARRAPRRSLMDLWHSTPFGIYALFATGLCLLLLAIDGAGGGVELPFGGVGKSGHGREKGFEALYGFSALKTVAAWHG